MVWTSANCSHLQAAPSGSSKECFVCFGSVGSCGCHHQLWWHQENVYFATTWRFSLRKWKHLVNCGQNVKKIPVWIKDNIKDYKPFLTFPDLKVIVLVNEEIPTAPSFVVSVSIAAAVLFAPQPNLLHSLIIKMAFNRTTVRSVNLNFECI